MITLPDAHAEGEGVTEPVADGELGGLGDPVERITALTWRRPKPKRSEHGWTKS